MIPGIDRVAATPLPLPESAWRITEDLQNKVKDIVLAAGYLIHGNGFVERDYRHWRLRLTDHVIDVAVDTKNDPGRLRISLQGEDVRPLRKLLSPYKSLPILKISHALHTQELIKDFPKQQ